MSTIKQLFNFPTLKLNTPIIREWMRTYPIECEYPLVDKNCLVGIEVEIENMPKAPPAPILWKLTDDGSLRNHGREYISWPVRDKQIEYALRLLFKTIGATNYEFSQRCSIHVHMNARTMQVDQLRAMILLYIVFERALFAFVGHNREKNIHCVPLHDSNITYTFDAILNGTTRPQHAWMKYTALNLVPLQDKGTIEFRHMHGTDDMAKIMVWINLLLCIKLYAYRNNLNDIVDEIFALNSNSQYRHFTHKVFGEFAKYVFPDNYSADATMFMEKGSTLVKYYINSNTFAKTLVKELHNPKLSFYRPHLAAFRKQNQKTNKSPWPAIFEEQMTTQVNIGNTPHVEESIFAQFAQQQNLWIVSPPTPTTAFFDEEQP